MSSRKSFLWILGILSGVGPVAAILTSLSLMMGCATSPRPSKADPIPADLVPAGFTADQCHWEELPQQDSGGFGSMDAARNAANAQKPKRTVKCSRKDELLPGTPRCYINGEPGTDEACIRAGH